jgi:drug/metabolite transporter superfamily protein YnfA
MDLILSMLVLAALAMVAGAILLWRRGGAQKQVWLMLLLAVIMIANVLIWTLPDKDGTAPIDRAAEGVR